MKDIIYVVILAVVLVLAWLFWQGRQKEAESRWQADRERVVAEADSQRALAQWAAQQADAAQKRATAAVLVADSLRARQPRLIVRIDSIPVPAEAVPYTAPRDSLIALLTQENGLLRTAIAEEHEAANALRVANTALRTTADSLAALVDRAPVGRPKLLGLIPLPEITIGYSAGIDRRDREFFDGPAVHVGWRVGL